MKKPIEPVKKKKADKRLEMASKIEKIIVNKSSFLTLAELLHQDRTLIRLEDLKINPVNTIYRGSVAKTVLLHKN